MSLLLLLACTGAIKPTDDAVDTGADTGTDTADSGDSGDSGDTGPVADVEGPDLPACTPQTGSGDLVALSGVVLAPEGPLAGLVVYSRSTGRIRCVGEACDTTGADVVCTEGVISAGLIDAHNHLQYNTLPPWQVGAEFEDRYEWRSDGRYWDYRTAYDEIADDYVCEIDKWAEARELMHGTTSTVGSSGGSCIDILIRNLDEDSSASGVSGYDIVYSASTVTDSVDATDCSDFLADLASGSLGSVLEHVGEGKNGSVRDEIDHMIAEGCTGPGMAYVHSTDATTAQLAQLAATGTSIVWSPRSNLALYGTTTPIEIADALGVPWAIGTDWTPSGSMAPTRELQCASDWLAAKGGRVGDQRLWEKTTTDAARVVGLDGVLGALVEGYRADLAVFEWSRTPYRGIIGSEPNHVKLVVVEGEALYGRASWIASLATHPDWCEALDVCGEAQAICMKVASSGDDAQTLEEIADSLTAAMAGVSMPSGYDYAKELFPLYECAESRDSCDLSAPATGDTDGDGIPDGDDVCPTVYDPNQWDYDADGEGDACDPCPLAPDTTECSGTALDTDGDGVDDVDDNCPYLANADQSDRDDDGIGDVCDACPDESNEGGVGCSTTIEAIRNPDDPNHPAVGSRVTFTGVVSADRPGSGFFVQEPGATEWGGLWAYAPGSPLADVADLVEVTGVVADYYGLTEIEVESVTVTGSGAVPEPLLVDACAIGTGGALAEPLESMLVVVEAVEVTDANPDDPEDYDEFEVDGCLRIDDLIYTALDQPALGTRYSSITGVVGYSFENSKLQPRDADDLE